jgi:prepilin-type N-terminal cleavage/methylation domain-containing protein
MKRNRFLGFNNRAFTLIELLVVIVIIAILMAIAIPAYLSQQGKARDAKTKQYLTYSYRSIRGSIPETNNLFQSPASLVSVVQASEPQLTISPGSCVTGLTSAAADAVILDQTTTSASLLMCGKSQSSNLWRLTATPSSAPTISDGALIPFSVTTNEMTDTLRAAGKAGDGLTSPDSSTGVWEGSTNMLTNGDFETTVANYAWQGGSFSLTQTPDPKFGSYAVLLTSTAGGAGDSFQGPSVSVTPSTVYSMSAWIKLKPGSGGMNVQEVAHSNTSGYYFGPIVTLSSSWQRVSFAFTTSGVETGVRPFFAVKTAINPGDGFVVDGVQIEQKTAATPFTPTSTAISSRAASRITAPAAALNSTQGWVAFRYRYEYPSSGAVPGSNPRLFDWRNDNNNILGLRWNTASRAWEMTSVLGGTAAFASSAAQTFSIGGVVTVIGKWSAGAIGVSVNGGAFVTAAVTNPVITAQLFDIGSAGAAATNYADGEILWSAVGTGPLTNSDATTINAFGNTDPTRVSLPTTAIATLVWNGASSDGSTK